MRYTVFAARLRLLGCREGTQRQKGLCLLPVLRVDAQLQQAAPSTPSLHDAAALTPAAIAGLNCAAFQRPRLHVEAIFLFYCADRRWHLGGRANLRIATLLPVQTENRDIQLS